jgi:hypothetical protein
MEINKTQKVILSICGIGLILIQFFPPFYTTEDPPLGYHFFLSKPLYRNKFEGTINVALLAIQTFSWLIISFIVFILFKKKN